VGIISSLVLLAGVGISSALPARAQANAFVFTVSGKVTGEQGLVRVVLYLWPPQAIAAALKPGQKVPLRVLASQTTGSGSYKLTFDPAALGVTMGSLVNMEVVASASGAVDTYSFPRQLATDQAGRPVLAALSGKPQMAPQTANLQLNAKCGHYGQRYCQCPKGGVPHFR